MMLLVYLIKIFLSLFRSRIKINNRVHHRFCEKKKVIQLGLGCVQCEQIR